MHRIAAHRARDRFTALLREVERGQAFAIERDGLVVAHLVPARTPPFRGLPPHAGAMAPSEPADLDAPLATDVRDDLDGGDSQG